MVRRTPPNTNAPINPVVSFSFIAAFVAATIVIIAALCGARVRSRIRKSAAIKSPPHTEEKPNIEATSPSPSPSPSPLPVISTPTTIPEVETEKNDDEFPQQSPPITNPPLGLTIKTTRRKLSASLSMKVGNLTLPKTLSRKVEEMKPSKSKQEDSIWTKTIMLGERCRVPDEDDAILYDEKGNRLSAYRVRTPRSVPVSRSNSFVEKDSVPM